jgi:hypothetical protein
MDDKKEEGGGRAIQQMKATRITAKLGEGEMSPLREGKIVTEFHSSTVNFPTRQLNL